MSAKSILLHPLLRFTRVSGHNVNFTISSSPATLTCGTIRDVQVEIKEGDVYAVFLRSDINHPPILADLPPNLGRRLYRDMRSFISSTSFRQNDDLEIVRNIGLHIYADISEYTIF